MKKDVTNALKAAAGRAPATDRLKHLKQMMTEARDLELDIVSMEEALAEKRKLLNKKRTEDLPALMLELGVNKMGLDASGNTPAYDVVLDKFYSASLPKDPERRAAALDLLKKMKLEGIIKNSFSVDFGKGEGARAKKLAAALKKMGVEYSNSVGVHPQTLMAVIRKQYESGKPLSPSELETLGGFVGNIVKLNKRED